MHKKDSRNRHPLSNNSTSLGNWAYSSSISDSNNDVNFVKAHPHTKERVIIFCFFQDHCQPTEESKHT